LNPIEGLRNAMEGIINDINIVINNRFEEIQKDQLTMLYSLSQKSDNDLSVLQLKSLSDLESEITFEITKDFMKSIKKYYDILNKFSLSLSMSSKFNLYLDTDKRKKQLVRLLVFWFYV
jgi:DNA gyrase/topoisomerase IV subunit A